MRKTNLLLNGSLYRRILPCTIAVLITAVFFSSCSVSKPSAYFTSLQGKDTAIKNFVTNDFESKIVKGDKISVTVSSLSPTEDLLFNSAAVSSAVAGTTASGSSAGGYVVGQDGTITLHRIGKIKAEGLTRRELAKQSETLLLPYLKEPIVNVSYLNHRVTVIGQVRTPQIINMPEEQISVLDALVLSGDVSTAGSRKNITVIREEGTDKKIKHINLEDNSIFSSPWYYLKPNDILLVNADNSGYVKEENRKRLQTTLSLVASGVSLLIIILDRVIK